MPDGDEFMIQSSFRALLRLTPGATPLRVLTLGIIALGSGLVSAERDCLKIKQLVVDSCCLFLELDSKLVSAERDGL